MKGLMFRLLMLVCVLATGYGLDNGAANTPPMGWRSWNCFRGEVNETVIRSVVDAFVAKREGGESLLSLGYTHVGVDDGWQACGLGHTVNNKSSFHALDGTPVVNTSKFSDLKAMVQYGHDRSVKMGWYDNNCICMDSYTLAQDPAWAERSFIGDVNQLLQAGFDSVKIDNCGDDQAVGFTSRLKHIKASGRGIMVENSNQGFGNPQRGACHGKMQCPGPACRGNPNNTLAPNWCPYNLFRTGGDIGPDFAGVMAKLQATVPYLDHDSPISRPNCWAYPDMLEVGNFNEANSTVGWIESRSHFGGWCIVSSPLILGLDVTDAALVDSVWPIINNSEAIAVNQHWAGHPGRLVAGGWLKAMPAWQLWAKAMPAGAQALFLVNLGDTPIDVTIQLKQVGLDGPCSMRDIWARRDNGQIQSEWKVTALDRHDSRFVYLTPLSN